MKESTKTLAKDIAKTVAAPVLTAFGTWALGELTGIREHLSNLWAADPRLVLVWTACAFVCGFACGHTVTRLVSIRSECAKDRETLNLIRGLPPQLLSIVRQAYDEGEVMASPLDQHVQMLASMRILGTAPFGIIGTNSSWMLQPDVRNLLRRSYDEIFGQN